MRTKRWKYFIYYQHSPVLEELYDLDVDPHEQNNLVDRPEFTKTLEELRKRTEEMYAAAK